MYSARIFTSPSVLASRPLLRAPARPAPSVAYKRAEPIVLKAATKEEAMLEREKLQDAYRALGIYLKTFGIDNAAEVARICDIAMNPNSMFEVYRDKKRNGNKHARRLEVEADVRPVVEYLRSLGATDQQIKDLIVDHPPILCYSAEERLKPFFEYIKEVGATDPIAVVLRRPSLLGLDPKEGLGRIVGWLKENNYTTEQILEYMSTSL